VRDAQQQQQHQRRGGNSRHRYLRTKHYNRKSVIYIAGRRLRWESWRERASDHEDLQRVVVAAGDAAGGYGVGNRPGDEMVAGGGGGGGGGGRAAGEVACDSVVHSLQRARGLRPQVQRLPVCEVGDFRGLYKGSMRTQYVQGVNAGSG
jgi:hypothetical protein